MKMFNYLHKYILVLVAVCVDMGNGGPMTQTLEGTLQWDVAITSGRSLEFFKDNLLSHTAGTDFTTLSELTYDPVFNMLLFVGQRYADDASIFSYDVATQKFHSMGKTNTKHENINSLAYDPVQGKLFWIDTEDNTICWAAVETGTIKSQTKNILYYDSSSRPQSLAIDSCRGYIYWTDNGATPTIQRSRYDGTEREMLPVTNNNKYSVSLDQQTKRIYWFEPGYNLLSADLDGKNTRFLLKNWGHDTNKLTITKDSIYLQDKACSVVWVLPKNPEDNEIPKTYANSRGTLFSIAANYPVTDQTQGNSDCEVLKRLVEDKPFCVNGTEVNVTCQCDLGYTGERCDISVCHNYCYSGNCTVSEAGEPKCSCSNGYSGDRCEGVSVCANYCLNNGTCSFNEENSPVCQCDADHEGPRCEKLKECLCRKHRDCQCCGNHDHESYDCGNNCGGKSLNMFFMELYQ